MVAEAAAAEAAASSFRRAAADAVAAADFAAAVFAAAAEAVAAVFAAAAEAVAAAVFVAAEAVEAAFVVENPIVVCDFDFCIVFLHFKMRVIVLDSFGSNSGEGGFGGAPRGNKFGGGNKFGNKKFGGGDGDFFKNGAGNKRKAEDVNDSFKNDPKKVGFAECALAERKQMSERINLSSASQNFNSAFNRS